MKTHSKTIKHFISKTKFVLMALIVVLSFACTAEDGPAGPPGADGINGTNGADGTDGNANVITSDWFGPDGQTFVTNGYTSYAEFDVSAPELIDDIYDNGVVLVYAKFENFIPEVWPTGYTTTLPLTISGGTTDHIYTSYAEPSSIKIRYRREGPEPTWTFSNSNRFRYVIIPSSNSGRNSIDFSKMTYEEVMDYFGLDY